MIQSPKCESRRCVHFLGYKNFSDEVEGDERVVCQAFPNGIPDEIAYGNVNHVKPFPNDGGITFEYDAQWEERRQQVLTELQWQPK